MRAEASDLSPDDRTRRGQQAERLLKDPLFVEVWDKLDAASVNAWRTCKDPVERERLWHAQDVVAKLRAAFASVSHDGAMAQKKLDELAKAPRRSVGSLIGSR